MAGTSHSQRNENNTTQLSLDPLYLTQMTQPTIIKTHPPLPPSLHLAPRGLLTLLPTWDPHVLSLRPPTRERASPLTPRPDLPRPALTRQICQALTSFSLSYSPTIHTHFHTLSTPPKRSIKYNIYIMRCFPFPTSPLSRKAYTKINIIPPERHPHRSNTFLTRLLHTPIRYIYPSPQ